MNGIHDMGGMHGFGSIPYEKNEPVFHHEWEARVYSMPTPFAKNFRFAIECMEPAHYLTSSYYERWLYVKIEDLIEQGIITRQELAEKIAYYRASPEAALPRREDPEAVRRHVEAIKAPGSHRRDMAIQPAFRVGDFVRTRNEHPRGHTRLPRYARDKRAQVVRYYGIQDIDDTGPAGEELGPQPLYAVRIEGRELWGTSAEPNSAVYLDMWESYIGPE
jgi:nitrile hydratase subunit beta